MFRNTECTKQSLSSSITLKTCFNVRMFNQILKGILVTYKVFFFPKLLGFPNLLSFYVNISDKCERLRIKVKATIKGSVLYRD